MEPDASALLFGFSAEEALRAKASTSSCRAIFVRCTGVGSTTPWQTAS